MPQYQNDSVESDYGKDGGSSVVGRQTWPGDGTPGSGGNGGWFESEHGEGVRGWSKNQEHGGVVGVNTGNGWAVYGTSDNAGVVGISKTWMGVYGETASTVGGSGVAGENKGSGSGVSGHGTAGNGGWFESDQAEGVRGNSKSPLHGGVVGTNTGGGDAGFFAGNVTITGNLSVAGDVYLTGKDYAEALTTSDESVSPGMVVVFDDDGEIHPCVRDHDARVAGIVSGAGDIKPAVVLDRHPGSANIALMGQVWCKADADPAPIRAGDLLTTSTRAGHCQRVTDPQKALGAVIGKAITPLSAGQELIRVFVGPR